MIEQRIGGVLRTALQSLIALSAIGALATTQADAQTWPTRPITAVIPFSPGNANDVVGRVVLDQLSQQLGQPIVIENRAGAGGTTGVASVARATPDGYTILVHSSTFSAGQALYKSLPYDTLHDFAAIIPLGLQPTVLVAAPSKGWKTLADLITAAKANPGKLTFASAGIGSASHLAAERLRFAAGFNALHVPYRGPNEALADVITGRVDFYFLPIAPALPLISNGKLVALAVSTANRAATLPDVPTTAEAGLKDAAYHFWTGLFAPAQTPKSIISKIYDETKKALEVPAVQDRLTKLGVDPMPMGMAEFDTYFREDVASTVKLAHDAGIPQSD
ncbi:MAG TPA: tripartite tricarboxylate transporter substrate binding protein [Xanthobacteraceae bacterium]|nr:tripartite tricarboxylate transporter substrate binding protein [Xanthobacteraceae bacterium]